MIPRWRAAVLIGGLLRTRRADGVPPALPAKIDWSVTIAVANEHFLVPAVRVALASSGLMHEVPRDVHRYLTLLYRMNQGRNRQIRRQALELLAALNAAGIEPILLKGGLVLVADVGLAWDARMMADIDIMVRPDQVGAATRTLEALGYALRNQYPDGHHAVGEYGREGSPASVDLHIELIDQKEVLPAAEVWQRARRIEPAAGSVCYMPDATDRLLHHLLHAQIHYLGSFYHGIIDLRQLHEFALLAADGSDPVDWTFIRDRMAQFGLLTPLHSYARAAGMLFGMRWPLQEPARWAARLHLVRCRLTMGFSGVRRVGIPWGNLRAAFAGHRMARLYRGSQVPKALWRIHHVLRVLRRHPIDFPLARLLRP